MPEVFDLSEWDARLLLFTFDFLPQHAAVGVDPGHDKFRGRQVETVRWCSTQTRLVDRDDCAHVSVPSGFVMAGARRERSDQRHRSVPLNSFEDWGGHLTPSAPSRRVPDEGLSGRGGRGLI